MKMRRRHFMKLGFVQTLVLAAASQAQTQTQADQLNQSFRREGLSILQGATDQENTQFSILHDRDLNIRFYIADESQNRILPSKIKKIQNGDHPKQITKVFASGLRLGEIYQLVAFDFKKNVIIERREFEMLDVESSSLSFAICSCMNDQKHTPGIWNTLVAKRPQILIFAGDSVYADDGAPSGIATPVHLWKRFCDSRQTLEIYFSKRLIPILATWDDHDFGMDDSDSAAYPYVAQSQKNFLDFFAQDEDQSRRLIRGPGISTAFYFGQHLFLLMDDRSYRQVKGSSGRYAHWGRAQEEWMLGLIQKHSGPSYVVNGSQIFPEMMFKESFSGDHAVQFNEVMKELRRASSKVIFASGDVHFSEISQIEKEILGYQTYELTSSSMHSESVPGILELVWNPRRIAATSKRNYILVQAVANGHGSQMRVMSYGAKGELLFHRDLNV